MSFKPHPTVRSRSSGNVTAAAAEQVVSATGGSSSQLQLGREAPVWVPDTASDRCQACDRKFSLIVRRHHCRCCGRLLCSSCSSFFVPLPYLDWQVARVCQVCDQALSNPSARNRQRTGEHRRSSSLSSLTTQEERIAQLVRELQIQFFNKQHTKELQNCHTMAASRDINSLPQEILSQILNYLDNSDQRICRFVSPHWSQAMATSNFYNETVVHLSMLSQEKLRQLLSQTYENTDFKHFRLTKCTMCLNTHFWQDMGPGIKSLELVSCELTERELCSILTLTCNLESLTLEDCRDLFISGNLFSNESERQRIEENLCNLQYLNLNNNKYLCDILLLNITRTTPNLVGLQLAGCNVMNDAGVYRKFYPESQDIQASPSVLTWRTVVKVVTNLAATLTDLDVSFNTGVDLELLAAVPGLNLSRVNFAGCGSVTLAGLLALLSTCPNLSSIDLSMCRRVFTGLPESVYGLFLAMSGTGKLQELKLNLLSIASFKSLALIKNLKRLELNNLDVPGTEIMKCLEDLDTSQLIHLNFKSLGASSSSLATLINSKDFSKLSYLDLSCGGETVDNNVVQAISRRMPNLTYLCLHNNLSISDAGVLGLAGNENSVNSLIQMKEWLNRNNKIFLGSRSERELHLTKIQQETSKEVLVAINEPMRLEAGLHLLTKLKELDLSQTCISGLSLKLGISSPDLRKLNIENSAEIEDSALYDFAIRHPRLEELRIGFTSVSDTSLISCLSCLPRLVHLNVSSCKNLSNAGVRAICQIAPQLETLVLSNCQNISMETARILETSMPNLTVVTLGLQAERYQISRISAPAPPAPPPFNP